LTPGDLENTETKMYTWHNSRNQHSRLDYFLVSSDIIQQIDSSVIKPGYRSDHSIVELNLKLSNHPKGRGIWKFNNSLLKDEIYNEEINQTVNNTLSQYKDRNSLETDLENQKFTIGDQLLFEMIKLEIRGKTIAYSSAKKKQFEQQEKNLEKQIDNLYLLHCHNPTEEHLQNLNTAQDELKTLREQKVEGIILRAKARWHLTNKI
jgi:hypothetical protein